MYGGAKIPPGPPSRGENAGARVGLCPNRVQTAGHRAKSQAITGLRHCSIGRYARVWTGIAIQMHYQYGFGSAGWRDHKSYVSILYKICALRNNASLLRMLRNVRSSCALALVGSILGTSDGNHTGTDSTHKIMTNLERALASRFTDSSEIHDVANHGCSGGVSGFIYSSELFEFFNEHESDIEDVLNELGVTLTQLVKDPEDWTFQELRETSVWIVVEYYCQQLVDAYAVA